MFRYMVLFYLFMIVNGLSPQKLVINNYKLVHHIINKKFYYLPKDLKEEIKQNSFIGLIKASERFDPDKNIKFSTYASYYIKGYAINSLKKHSLYQKRFKNQDFNSFLIENNMNNKYDAYDLMDYNYLVNSFYDTCENKDIMIDYFHNKISKYEIAKKYNISSKKVTYKINRNLHLFKINNSIEKYK